MVASAMVVASEGSWLWVRGWGEWEGEGLSEFVHPGVARGGGARVGWRFGRGCVEKASSSARNRPRRTFYDRREGDRETMSGSGPGLPPSSPSLKDRGAITLSVVNYHFGARSDQRKPDLGARRRRWLEEMDANRRGVARRESIKVKCK